jgi:epoxyqueuosine reductase
VNHAAHIIEAALELGFVRCGFSRVELLPRERFFRDWLAEGRAAEMTYLWRRFRARLDPRVLFPWARSVVSLAYAYPPPPPAPRDWRLELRGRIAAYARGRDYHEVVGERLRQLAARIAAMGTGIEARPYVDTGPVLEREWGLRGGLGWFGKNTMLLDRQMGSWFFLAEVLTSIELPASAPAAEHCGTCRRCLDDCPTGALAADYRIDPRRCISYLTIEHRGAIPALLRPHLGNWIFGCDVCQNVCPWNAEPAHADDFDTLYPRLTDIMDLDAAGFRARFGGTAVMRTRRRGLLRNAAVALGNSGNRDAVPALERALLNDEPLVRGHAAWALGRLGGSAARDALDRVRNTDPDDAVRAETEAALRDTTSDRTGV